MAHRVGAVGPCVPALASRTALPALHGLAQGRSFLRARTAPGASQRVKAQMIVCRANAPAKASFEPRARGGGGEGIPCCMGVGPSPQALGMCCPPVPPPELSRPSHLSPTSSPCPQIREVGAKELEQAVQERAKTLIIDFYATWCGPCVLQAKELVKVGEARNGRDGLLRRDGRRAWRIGRNWDCCIPALALSGGPLTWPVASAQELGSRAGHGGWAVEPGMKPSADAQPPDPTLYQVAEAVGDGVEILKIDTDRHPDISNQLQVGRGGGL